MLSIKKIVQVIPKYTFKESLHYSELKKSISLKYNEYTFGDVP